MNQKTYTYRQKMNKTETVIARLSKKEEKKDELPVSGVKKRHYYKL